MRRIWAAVMASVAAGYAPPVYADADSNRQAASAATAYLERSSVQNADGSYGQSEDVKALETATVAEALRAYNRRSPAYFRAITWLENHAMGNVDYHARRAIALSGHGDDVSVDREFLKASVSQQVGGSSGWGLSDVYAPSPRDTGLVLLAFAATGVTSDVLADVQAGIAFLKASQAPDGSWAVSSENEGDALVTALGLRSLAALSDVDPSTATAANDAASYLLSTVPVGSAALTLSQAALARIEWMGRGSAASQVESLVAQQDASGSWGASAFVTAKALETLAAELGRDDAQYQQIVSVDDFELRSAVNLEIGRNRGDQIRQGDLEELSTLDASGFGIADLAGLENAPNLTFVDLRNTNVTDISALSGLPSSTTILLQNTPWAGLMCDATQSGAIDVGDATVALQILSGTVVPSLLQKTRVDISPESGPGDGVVNSSDALLVIQRVGGYASSACP